MNFTRLISALVAPVILAGMACNTASPDFAGVPAGNGDSNIVPPLVLGASTASVSDATRDLSAGVVVVECLVNAAGHVVGARVVSSTSLELVNDALTSVREWAFEPGTVDGVPTEMQVVVPVLFGLQR